MIGMMLDSIDEQLINLLMKDARQSSGTLAKQLLVSSSSVRRRMKKLIDQGVIRIVALPEPGKLGLPLEAVIALDVEHDRLNSTMDALRKYPQVTWLAAVSGRFDIIAHALFPSTEELFKFMESEIGRMEEIKNSETFICLHVEKHV